MKCKNLSPAGLLITVVIVGLPPAFRCRYYLSMQNRYPYVLFLQWLSVALATLFVFFVCWDLGLVRLLIDSDKSYISSLIMLIFMAMTIAAGVRAFRLSRELQYASRITSLLDNRQGGLEMRDDGEPVIDSQVLPEGIMKSQLRKQMVRRRQQNDQNCSRLMLENMERSISGSHDFGWLVADLMIKLGLLGTVIGFIMMLGAVTTIDSADIATIQNMLLNMSDGMRIALFTTLTGLVGGSLLGLQYHFLDRAAARLNGLVADTVEIWLGRAGD